MGNDRYALAELLQMRGGQLVGKLRLPHQHNLKEFGLGSLEI